MSVDGATRPVRSDRVTGNLPLTMWSSITAVRPEELTAL